MSSVTRAINDDLKEAEERARDAAAYAADSTQAPTGGNILAQITRVAAQVREAQMQIAEHEEQLKAAQQRYRTLVESTLPQLMQEAGQKRLTTSDGWELSVSDVIRASIPEGKMAQAAAWLIEHGQGSIIKHELKMAFGRGEEQKAAEAVDALREHGFVPSEREFVHPQTLGAVVREMMKEGRDVDRDLLGVFIQPTVKMKREAS